MSSIGQEIEEAVGGYGRQISGSKTAPKGHEVFFNACIFDSDFRQVWYGDFDFTVDSEKLQKVASMFCEKLYVTREMPFRFEPLTKKSAKDNERVRIFKP